MQLCMLYMGDCCCKALRTKLALSRTVRAFRAWEGKRKGTLTDCRESYARRPRSPKVDGHGQPTNINNKHQHDMLLLLLAARRSSSGTGSGQGEGPFRDSPVTPQLALNYPAARTCATRPVAVRLAGRPSHAVQGVASGTLLPCPAACLTRRDLPR
jgi:hypothetical protein